MTAEDNSVEPTSKNDPTLYELLTKLKLSPISISDDDMDDLNRIHSKLSITKGGELSISSTEADSESTSQSNSMDLLRKGFLMQRSRINASSNNIKNGNSANVNSLMEEISSLKAEKFLMEQEWKEKYSRALTKHAVSLRSTPTSSVGGPDSYRALMDSMKKDLMQNSFLISEERFLELKSKEPESLSPGDFFRMTVHEMIKPFKQMIQEEERKFQDFKEKSKMNSERLASDLNEALCRNRKLLEDLERLRMDRDQILDSNVQLKHSSDVAQMDKQYLQGERSETKKIISELNETITQKERENQTIENENQKLKDRIISLEDALKTLESTKIKGELDKLSVKMNQELDQVRTTNREIYEREVKSLRESRDMLMNHLNVSEKRKLELEERLHKITLEYEKLRNKDDGNNMEMHASLQLKTFECDRLKQSLSETMNTIKSLQHEKESLSKKLDFVSKENTQLQLDMKQNISNLQVQKEQLQSQIGLYEEMEKLMDEFISSQASNNSDENNKWFSNVISSLPVSTQRRMKQSANLCKGLRALEQENKKLREDNENLKKREDELLEDIKLFDAVINQKGEDSKMMEQLKSTHKDLQKERNDKSLFEKQFRNSQSANESLLKKNDELSEHVKVLLEHRQRFEEMKQVLDNFLT